MHIKIELVTKYTFTYTQNWIGGPRGDGSYMTPICSVFFL